MIHPLAPKGIDSLSNKSTHNRSRGFWHVLALELPQLSTHPDSWSEMDFRAGSGGHRSRAMVQSFTVGSGGVQLSRKQVVASLPYCQIYSDGRLHYTMPCTPVCETGLGECLCGQQRVQTLRWIRIADQTLSMGFKCICGRKITLVGPCTEELFNLISSWCGPKPAEPTELSGWYAVAERTRSLILSRMLMDLNGAHFDFWRPRRFIGWKHESLTEMPFVAVQDVNVLTVVPRKERQRPFDDEPRYMAKVYHESDWDYSWGGKWKKGRDPYDY